VNELALLRDDGPLARRVVRLLGGRQKSGPFAWLGPPLLRATEYGGLVAITAAAEPDALPACFAFLAAIAFHHYDVLYGVRSGRGLPPPWVDAIGGGWELRLVGAGILAAAGTLELGLFVAASALGAVYVGESAARWRRSRESRGEPAANVGPEAPE
jgi:hypothetical protein